VPRKAQEKQVKTSICQEGSGGSRRSQGEPGGARGSQGEPGEPGGARGSQGEAGEAGGAKGVRRGHEKPGEGWRGYVGLSGGNKEPLSVRQGCEGP
jgi:hypothetical protein